MTKLACLILLAACSTSAKPAVVLDVRETSVLFEGSPIAKLHADGTTESVGDGAPGPGAKLWPGPTLHADGAIDLTKGGFKARVDADGRVFVVPPKDVHQPEQLFGRITGDALLTAGAKDGGVRLEGADLVMYADGKVTNVLGRVDPATQGRTALVMTAAFLIDMSIRAPK